ncbi:hypothetical protein JKP88DRAFT_242631 [Tribonema minus]|uniref:Integrase catalytic domain-containing protein n=1 Tax=Tribonema minus TaxID=303371 RepID=A0A835ZH33_9STRA|nr:hypothetical protein JKP88DRAFT_242631 [Tribonema minus]
MGLRNYYAKITSKTALRQALQALADHNACDEITTEMVALKPGLDDAALANVAQHFQGAIAELEDGSRAIKVERASRGEDIEMDKLQLFTSGKSVWLQAFNWGGAEETEDFFSRRPGKENGIKAIYSLPANPTGNAAAETSVKTIKTLLFSYWMGDGANRKKVRLTADLDKVLRVINNSQNAVTGYRPSDLQDPECPKAVLAKAKATMFALAKGRSLPQKMNYKLRKGDKVRIDVIALSNSIRQLRKQGRWKSTHNASFSEEVYTVVSHSDVDNTVRIEELPGRVLLRGQCLLVPKVEDREKFVTEWQGKRKADGVPEDREDPFGFQARQKTLQEL